MDGSGGEEEVRTVSEGPYEAPDSASRGAFPTGTAAPLASTPKRPSWGHRGVPSRSRASDVSATVQKWRAARRGSNDSFSGLRKPPREKTAQRHDKKVHPSRAASRPLHTRSHGRVDCAFAMLKKALATVVVRPDAVSPAAAGRRCPLALFQRVPAEGEAPTPRDAPRR